MKPTDFMTSGPAVEVRSTKANSVQVRPIKGVPAIVRSAAAEASTAAPTHRRKNQLEDYVARIRQSCGQNQRSAAVASPQFNTRINEGRADQAFSPPQLERSDAAHIVAPSQTHAVAAPHIPASQFPDDVVLTTEKYLSQSTDRPDVIAPVAQVPAAVTNVADAEANDPAAAERAAYQQQLIEQISLAIASTLTNAESQRLHSKLHAGTTSTPPNHFDAAPPEATSTSESKSTGEIPADVAAWDVEDFHWPALSNQMIATASDAMQELYDHVQTFRQDENETCHRVAITGAGRGEGTSSIAISLARWAAACGQSVLLIDADLASPGLTTQVGLQHGLSWMNAIDRQDDPAEVIIRSQRHNLCVMPLAPIADRAAQPSCLYDSLGAFLGKVERHFDWIFLDFGPGSQLLADLSRPERLIDSALLIGSAATSDLPSLQFRLQQLGINRFVVTQNSVQQQEAA